VYFEKRNFIIFLFCLISLFYSFFKVPQLFSWVHTGNLQFTTQAELDNLNPGLTHVTGDLIIGPPIGSTTDIKNISILSALQSVGGNMSIIRITNLTNVDALAALKSTGEDMIIAYTTSLTNVDGLAALGSVGRNLMISYNDALSNVAGLTALQSVSNSFNIQQNKVLINLDGLAALQSTGNFNIMANPSLMHIDGLATFKSAGIILIITDNASLTNVDGLAALQTITTTLIVAGNKDLEFFCGLYKAAKNNPGINWIISTNKKNPTQNEIINDCAPNGSIAAQVFCDANGNGLKDDDEKGIPGCHIYLHNQVGPQPAKFPKCSSTNNGDAMFKNLPNGEYKVVIENNTLPAGAISTTGGSSYNVSLAKGEHFQYALFGYIGLDCNNLEAGINGQTPGCSFPFVSCTKNWPNEGWDNLIDGDEDGWDGTVTAPTTNGIPSAIICLNNNMQNVQFNEVRIKTDNGTDDDGDAERQVTQVELLVSTTGIDDADFTTLATINIGSGAGEKTQWLGTVSAKYLKVRLLAPGAWAKFAQIVELQLFNTGQQVAIGQSSDSYNLAVLPETTQLMNAYPNPFNPQTTVEYNLVNNSNVSIRVFDLHGREIDSLVKNYQLAGFYHVVWDANRFSSGTYFIVMQAGQTKQTKKIVLLK
jgi:hypothetical protein